MKKRITLNKYRKQTVAIAKTERYCGNGKIWEWKKKEKGRGRKKGERGRRDNDNYYLLRIIINKKFCFSIQFFPISIYCISINIVSKENVYHIYQNMENHRQYLRITPWGYGVSGL